MRKRIIQICLAAVLCLPAGTLFAKDSSLCQVAEKGDVAEVKRLLDDGVNVNQKDKYGRPPLGIAAYKGHVDIVKLLLDSGGDVEAETRIGKAQPLYWAAEAGKVDVVKVLLDYNAKLDAKAEDGTTALHVAANSGHVDLVKLLLERGADAEAKDNNGDPVLFYAIEGAGNPGIVELLLSSGANVNARDHQGFTPLDRAIRLGENHLIPHLLDHGAGLEMQNRYGWTPLKMAIHEKNEEAAVFLLDHGATVNCKDYLRMVVESGSSNLLQRMLTACSEDIDEKLRWIEIELIRKGLADKMMRVLIATRTKLKVQKLFSTPDLSDREGILLLSDALLEAELEKLPSYLLQNSGSEATLLVEVKKRLRDAQMEISKCKNRAQALKEAGKNDEAVKQLDLSVAIQGYQASLLSIKSELEKY